MNALLEKNLALSTRWPHTLKIIYSNKKSITKRRFKMNSVDEILHHVNASGRFQIILTFILCLINGPTGTALWLTNFIAVNSPWRCMNYSSSCIFNKTLPSDNNDMCSLNRTEWEFVATPESSITVYFDIQCDKMWASYLATSGLFIGWAVGSPIISQIADKYGRKCVVFPSFVGIIVFGFLSAFSPNIYVYIVLRFIVGFAILQSHKFAL